MAPPVLNKEIFHCLHPKLAKDPHPLCRRCRNCIFFTDECSYCEIMSDNCKREIQRTWHKSDCRAAQRLRAKSFSANDSSSAECAATPKSGKSDVSPEGVNNGSNVKKESASTSKAIDHDASKMAAVEAENLALREKLARLECLQFTPLSVASSGGLFHSPSGVPDTPGRHIKPSKSLSDVRKTYSKVTATVSPVKVLPVKRTQQAEDLFGLTQ